MSLSVSIAWRILKPIVRPWHMRRALAGRPLEFGVRTWERVAPALHWGLSHHLLEPAERKAAERLIANPLLNGIYTLSDLDGGWTATPFTLLTLWRHLNSLRPKVILELGSGLSTRLFAAYARQCAMDGNSVPIVVSLEHEREWFDATNSQLSQLGLSAFVRAMHVPLREHCVNGRDYICYSDADVAELLTERSVDMCFIDGPPGTIGRSGTLPVISPYLAPRSTVFLDDAFRPEEQAAIHYWQSLFPVQPRTTMLLTSRGLGRFEINQPTSRICQRKHSSTGSCL